MNWQSAFRSRNPNRQQMFDQDLQGLLGPATPTAQPKPITLGQPQPQAPQMGQPTPFYGQASSPFGGLTGQMPQQTAPQAQQNSLSTWLTQMQRRQQNVGQQVTPGWRNALAQGWGR